MEFIPSARNISVQNFYNIIVSSWEKNLRLGNRFNGVYEIPLARGWILIKALLSQDGCITLHFLHLESLRKEEVQIRGDDWKIGGVGLLESARRLLLSKSRASDALYRVLTGYGIEAQIIIRQEEPFRIVGMQPYGC